METAVWRAAKADARPPRPRSGPGDAQGPGLAPPIDQAHQLADGLLRQGDLAHALEIQDGPGSVALRDSYACEGPGDRHVVHDGLEPFPGLEAGVAGGLALFAPPKRATWGQTSRNDGTSLNWSNRPMGTLARCQASRRCWRAPL
jgi:hypothetical protein